MNIDQNKFWKEINEKQLSPENIAADFENFKSSSINHKLALFNPEVNGVYYLKTVNFLLASTLSSAEKGLLENIMNRELGNPLGIRYEGLSVCLDYLQATKEVVHEYLAFKDEHRNAFYTKNPAGKYYDKALDGHSQEKEVIEIALKQGVLTDIIDIDNQSEVNEASKKFLQAYSPSAGWITRADSWAVPFSYIWQALFVKENGV
jgi:hypothetical protein